MPFIPDVRVGIRVNRCKDWEYHGTDVCMTATATSLSAKITAEVILGKIRLHPTQDEPEYLPGVRLAMMQLKKSIGPEAFDEITGQWQNGIHALVDLLFDRVCGITRPATVEALKKLPMTQRMPMEALAASLTGQLKERGDRWNDVLYRVHKRILTLTALSVSGITPDDFREGYHEFVHEVVDEIWKNRHMLVS
jgi:hypothetical protein